MMGTTTEESHQPRPLQIFFLPLMSPGHMIPMTDMAKLFAARPGVSATLITTPGNEPLVRPSIQSSPDVELLLVPFPSSVAHLLPNGEENLSSMSFSDFINFFGALQALRKPLEELFHARRPDCIVSDYFFPWTADTAAALDIPRLAFYVHGIFTTCVYESLLADAPHEKVSDDNEPFIVEGLPHRIELTRTEVCKTYTTRNARRESLEKSYGVVLNSFYELEPEYGELYRERSGRRAYYVGPVSLSSAEVAVDRGQKLDNPAVGELMTWLDSMGKESVMYVCFGSLNEFSTEQLREIALGLEASGRAFVWAVRNVESEAGPGWLPEGLEERVKGKGVVVRGWVPQVVILNHPAVGGFVTHCGWNSTLEGVTAGVAMVAWPVEYEQFVNERLITQVLRTGVSVGRGEIMAGEGEEKKKVVRAEKVAGAVRDVMGEGTEAEERRERAREYAAMAKKAVEEGGSSYGDVSGLIEEIRENSLVKKGSAVSVQRWALNQSLDK